MLKSELRHDPEIFGPPGIAPCTFRGSFKTIAHVDPPAKPLVHRERGFPLLTYGTQGTQGQKEHQNHSLFHETHFIILITTDDLLDFSKISDFLPTT